MPKVSWEDLSRSVWVRWKKKLKVCCEKKECRRRREAF